MIAQRERISAWTGGLGTFMTGDIQASPYLLFQNLRICTSILGLIVLAMRCLNTFSDRRNISTHQIVRILNHQTSTFLPCLSVLSLILWP